MRIFLDTNVIVDLIADRQPYSQHAVRIFQRAEQKQLQLFASSHSIITTHYLMSRYLDEKALREVLLNLLDFLTVQDADAELLRMALRSGHRDFEDAVQVLCATRIGQVDFIVTRNLRDFKTSEIPALSPEELCLRLDL